MSMTSTKAVGTETAATPLSRVAAPQRASRQYLLWIVVLVLAIGLPWVGYDYEKARHSGFLLTMLSQMGMMVIFALSYNMLMGQAGLLSFGHAVFFGLGGYATIHFLEAADNGMLPVPLELIPLLSGATGLIFGIVFGYMATKQRATAFAMITMGIGELITTAAMMFMSFFGGEGGVTANRMIDHSLFGLSYASSVQVYYLILAWTFLSGLAMLFLTRTPLGAMANATRDNFERAQFMGYDPRRVRFLQFALSGLFAGLAGGLYAITYEIVTFDAVSSALSANAVLMVYIGGANAFFGPILGAVLITLMQSGVSLMSNAWLVYVGVMFIAMVTFAPSGLAGMILAHGPVLRAGRMRRLIVPYLRLLLPGLALLIGFVFLVELSSFHTIGAAQGKILELFGHRIDTHVPTPWAIAVGLFALGVVWLRSEIRVFARVWDELTGDLRERSL